VRLRNRLTNSILSYSLNKSGRGRIVYRLRIITIIFSFFQIFHYLRHTEIDFHTIPIPFLIFKFVT